MTAATQDRTVFESGMKHFREGVPRSAKIPRASRLRSISAADSSIDAGTSASPERVA